MRIGIDGRALQGARTGVGRYTYELCKRLDRFLQDAEFVVYSNVPVDISGLSSRWKLRLDTWGLARHLKPVLWLKLRCGWLCRRDDLDVFWGTATFLPALARGTRTVITVYDLTFIVAPDSMSRSHRWAFKLFFEKDVRRADCVTTISNGTSDRLFRLLGRRAALVVVPAVDSRFGPKASEEIKACLDCHSISPPYILSVATWEPRKNIEVLIRAFLELKKSGLLSKHKLVLVGGRGWKDERLAALVRNTDSDEILPLGFVLDDDLPSLYAGAELFVFPSLYEGYGIPVLEARACRTRVVTTDSPELREAGGEEAVYVAPTLEGVRDGVLFALSRPKPAEVDAPRLPTWEAGARNLAAALVGKSDRVGLTTI